MSRSALDPSISIARKRLPLSSWSSAGRANRRADLCAGDDIRPKFRAVFARDDALRGWGPNFCDLSTQRLHLFSRENGKTLRRTRNRKAKMTTGENFMDRRSSDVPKSKAK